MPSLKPNKDKDTDAKDVKAKRINGVIVSFLVIFFTCLIDIVKEGADSKLMWIFCWSVFGLIHVISIIRRDYIDKPKSAPSSPEITRVE